MRWIRLDLTWSHSAWLSVMSAESRLAWVELLCYTKGYGSAGRVKALAPDRFARMIYVGEESVRQLLTAAETHGALMVEGSDWIICKWMQYQGDETNAERQKRFRENHKKPNNARNALLTDVTTTETETETERNPPIAPPGGKGADAPQETIFDFLPPEFKTRELVSRWTEFCKHRAELKQKPYKGAGLRNLASLLVAQGFDAYNVEQLLAHCMASNWRGIPAQYVTDQWRMLRRPQSRRQLTEADREVINR